MILAKKCIIILKTGRRYDYTHVTKIYAENKTLRVEGETIIDKMPAVIPFKGLIEDIELMIVEFYIPPDQRTKQ